MTSATSKVQVRKAYAQDFEQVYSSLLAAHDPRISKEDWHQLFINHWHSTEDYYGYLLAADGEIVGFLGTIFSRRKIRGQEYKFCNLSSWIVQPEHRRKSLFLLFPLLKLADYTFTNLTAQEHVAKIHRELGFTEMGSGAQIILPLGGFSWGRPHKPELIFDPERIKDHLQGDDIMIFNDHLAFKCSHILLEADHDYCYLIASRLIKKRVPILYVHYISNLPLFVKLIYQVIFKMLYHFKAVGLLVEDRFLEGLDLRWAIKYQLPHYKLFKSPALQAQDIDNLYSERILLHY
ncbi:MAG: hypothetical protein PHU44_02610 [Syntrophales bacterium]|nr:hypothetical protein [Syntrophales bacterium]